jgi:acyl-CoA thioester hydrolase
VSVLLDEATRKPTALTPEILKSFQPWIRLGVNPHGETPA